MPQTVAFALAVPCFLGPVAAQPLPGPAEALTAHATVRGWIQAWSVPATPAEPAPEAWGVSVTLRLDGRVLARATALSTDPAAQPGSTPLSRAAAQAVREARSKLPVPNDALADDLTAELAQRVTVSLEFYATPVPIPESELSLPLAGTSPGAEALVISVGDGPDQRTLVSGVDSQLTRGVDPARELSALAAELSGSGATALRPVAELLEAGYRFARAPVLHLAMPYAEAAPVFLDRGQRRIGPDEVRTDSIRAMGDAIAAHLRSRLWPGVERYGLSGDLRLVTGASSPVVAPAFEQGLVAFALFRHAELNGPEADASRQTALRILRDLTAVESDEENPWATSTGAAMVAAALSKVDPAARAAEPELDALQARVLDVLRRAYDPAAQAFNADIPPAARGLIAWALVLSQPMDASITRERAESAVRAAFRDTPQGQLVAQTPFLVWAELALHPDGDLPAGVALDEMRSLVWDHQLRRADLRPEDADLAGGVVFTRGRSVLPTWQSMRPLAALATMMGDDRLTPGVGLSGKMPGELVRLTEGLRFVRQLTITGDALFLARRADQAAWGVRPAVWEPIASLEAGALALLTTSETLHAMDAVARRASVAQPAVSQ
jgi:hypothetical protein